MLVAGAVTIVYVMLPSTCGSSTPVTVTVWGTFQFAGVKFTLAGVTVPSAVLLELRSIVTSAVGCDVRTMVKVAVPPASVVVRPEVGVTVMTDVSLSMLVTETSLAIEPVVVAVAARRRRRDDGVGDVAVVQVVVDAGYGNGLRLYPSCGREREARPD